MDAVRQEAAPHVCVVQSDRRGTAHAALMAAPYFGDGKVAILYADNPLIRPETLSRLLERDEPLALLAFRPDDPGRYGRVFTRDGSVERIVEWADASDAERMERLCNAGVLCAMASDMARWLQDVRADNAKGEYYLTDVVTLARAENARVAAVEAPAEELAGVNSRSELAAAEAAVQAQLRAAAMDAGVTLIDPGSVFLCADTELAPDVIVEPNVRFGPGMKVATGALIRSFSHLEGCTIGPDCIVGPHARLRPGTELGASVHGGNFVEVKATRLGAGAKASHLTYLGDADVGEGHATSAPEPSSAITTAPRSTARPSARTRSLARTARWLHLLPSATALSSPPAASSPRTCHPKPWRSRASGRSPNQDARRTCRIRKKASAECVALLASSARVPRLR